MTSAHPPFAHNPHVYDGIDPAGNPTTGMVVHSDVAVNTPGGPEAVDVEDVAAVEAAGSDEDADVDVNGDGEIDGYEAFTKAELVDECAGRGLPTSGNKPDLVKRLQDADAAAAEPSE